MTKIKNYGNIEEYQMSESLYTKESKKMEKFEMRVIERIINRLETLKIKNLIDKMHIDGLKAQVEKTTLKDSEYVIYLLEETVSDTITVDEVISLLKRLKTITVTPPPKRAK